LSQLSLYSTKCSAALLPRCRLVEVFELARDISIIEGCSMISKGKASECGPIEVTPCALTVVTSANGIGKNPADW
jgi:hypothetical protein